MRVVFAGVYLGGRTAASRWLLRTALGLALPHYRGKLRIAHLMSRAGADPVVFGLPNYYQNDEIVRDDILAGGYPLPVHDKGVNRIDLRDAAEIVARALTEPAFPSGGHVLSGPASISGAGAARVWSDALGRPVRYDGTGDWRAVLTRRLDGQKRDDFLHTYALLAKRGMATSARSVAATTALLGRPSRSYESYVRDTADLWQAAPRA
ncbi:hypothetical protein [Dactylosporangium sp. NPDC005555]|uniref:hypothetical protein n=1 Tax=Dactylosporangium sp. NPDC005555 TaxID=3154889 RepID=UPI0033B24039